MGEMWLETTQIEVGRKTGPDERIWSKGLPPSLPFCRGLADSSVDQLSRHGEPCDMANRSDPVLEDVLGPFLSDMRAVLGDGLIGLYLYGSAVTGGFDAGVSDLDLVAVTRGNVTELELSGLDKVHRKVIERDHAWADRLEIVYVARRTLSNGLASRDRLAVISPGEPFHVTGPASDWTQNWYLVRETGIALFGPSPSWVMPPISHADFLAAVGRYLDYLRNKPSLGYAVLSACRAVRTIQTGNQCSKQEGAVWVREQMPEWAWLINRALASRLSRGSVGFDDAQTREAASVFVGLLADSVQEAVPNPRSESLGLSDLGNRLRP
jgi:predicted nucleotidyltransferase